MSFDALHVQQMHFFRAADCLSLFLEEEEDGGGVRNIIAFKLECLYGCLSDASVTTARFVAKYVK